MIFVCFCFLEPFDFRVRGLFDWRFLRQIRRPQVPQVPRSLGFRTEVKSSAAPAWPQRNEPNELRTARNVTKRHVKRLPSFLILYFCPSLVHLLSIFCPSLSISLLQTRSISFYFVSFCCSFCRFCLCLSASFVE